MIFVSSSIAADATRTAQRRELKSCRSVDVNRTVLAGIESRSVEMRSLIVRFVAWQKRLPADAIVQGQPVIRSPSVLDVRCDVVLAPIADVFISLLER